MRRPLAMKLAGGFGLGLLLGAIFIQYQRPGLALNWLAGLIGCA